jgi:uncharacterized protein
MDSCVVTVYRGTKVREMYLFVREHDGLRHVPADLLDRFGEPSATLSFELTPERKLARAQAGDVLRGISERGYYLQLPPTVAHLVRRHE